MVNVVRDAGVLAYVMIAVTPPLHLDPTTLSPFPSNPSDVSRDLWPY